MARDGKTRVLIVVQNLPVPFDRRVWLEATSLTAAGYAVTVICPKMKGYDTSFETIEGVDIYRYPLPVDAQGTAGFVVEFVWCFLGTVLKTLQVSLRGRGFDILHVCNPPETYWPLGGISRLLGKRFVFDHHDLSPEMYAAKFQGGNRVALRGLLFLERMTMRTANLVIATNESYKRVAIERGGRSPDEVQVVRSGPDLTRFSLFPPDPAWRQGHRHVLVYLGEICKQDGVDHLVRALRILRDELGRDDVHCLFVGGGPHQPAIRAYAEELGVMDLCTFTGRVSDDEMLCRILSSADIGVDPDPKNPWSDRSTMNKIVEYMYFGLPIVAYDLTETRVSAEGAARYAEPNVELELARHIAALLDDPGLREKMGRIGRERVRRELAWEHSVPHLLAAYEALT